MSSTAIVTDSTASLPPELAVERDITVVPLQVIIGARSYTEGEDVTPDDIAQALRDFNPVNTSRPSPEAFARAYLDAAERGATEVVSIHLSSEVSGTFDSAEVAAKRAPLPVHTVDSRQVGWATGYAALTAADLRDASADVDAIAAGARARGESATALFYVDTLEFLRRGGRMGAAAAMVGSALAVKPILTVRDGRIGPLEKVRTSARAIARLQELAVAKAEEAADGVDVAVQHLANADRAQGVADHLQNALGLDLVPVSEVGAVIGAHVGPGMLAVTVAARPSPAARA